MPLTATEKEKLRWESITGYNEAMAGGRRLAARNGSVKTGIDVLEEHNFELLHAPAGKKKIGIVTNQTGVDSQGRRTIDVLAHAPGVSLEAIFSPEHGVTGALDTTDIGNSKDALTGAPVYSVYGATDAARRPSVDILKTLDAVVRNLVFNPRTPLDVSLGLMKNLLIADLRNLSGNKEVADTVRKLALRMFKQRSENANKK